MTRIFGFPCHIFEPYTQDVDVDVDVVSFLIFMT